MAINVTIDARASRKESIRLDRTAIESVASHADVFATIKIKATITEA
jgi:hypothetical protein